jgi:hypothetical protein
LQQVGQDGVAIGTAGEENEDARAEENALETGCDGGAMDCDDVGATGCGASAMGCAALVTGCASLAKDFVALATGCGALALDCGRALDWDCASWETGFDALMGCDASMGSDAWSCCGASVKGCGVSIHCAAWTGCAAAIANGFCLCLCHLPFPHARGHLAKRP